MFGLKTKFGGFEINEARKNVLITIPGLAARMPSELQPQGPTCLEGLRKSFK